MTLMRKLEIYVDSSVIGGCEDGEFSVDSLALFEKFVIGEHILVLSEHTIREIDLAPESVRNHILRVPAAHQKLLRDTPSSVELADAYLARGILGPGSRSDAIHVALATAGHVNLLVSWNFKHIVNFGRIRLFNAVNLEMGWGPIEIRTPKEVLDHE